MGDPCPWPGTEAFRLGGTHEWTGQTGLHAGYYTSGQHAVDTAGTYRAGSNERERELHALSLCGNVFARLSMANRIVGGHRSWSYETAGRPEWSGGGDRVIYSWDEPLWGSASRAAGVLWGGVKVYGDEPSHAARYALAALATRTQNKGRWRFALELPGLPKASVDAADLARLALFLAAQCAGDQFAHPWVLANGCSDRAFARGFATLEAGARAGVLSPDHAEVALTFLKGSSLAKYRLTPGGDVNLGKANTTMTPPFASDEPVWQFFGFGLVPATLFDVAANLHGTQPALAAELCAMALRVARWTCDMLEDPAKDAPGYVTVPADLRTPGKPLPDSIASYVADGTAVRHYGDGTGVGKYWVIRSLRCAGALGDVRSRQFADALVAQVRAQAHSGDYSNVGWAADEQGHSLVEL